MSEPTDADKIVSVRAFALWTTHVAKLLGCSYADAAVFLAKLGPLVTLMQDHEFQAQLTRFTEQVAAHPIERPIATQSTPGKVVH